MSESASTQTKKSPTHLAYQVTERSEKSFWNRIGVAWQHTDGNGFNIRLDCTPVDGRVTLRVATEAEQ